MASDEIGSFDVIIVGAGMGGLVAGNALLQRGYSVLILDQQKIPGGCTTNFTRRDFRFDVSTHLLNGCEPGGAIYEGLRKIGAHERIEFIKVDTLFLWRDLVEGRDLRLPVAMAEFVETLCQLFPHAEQGIRDFYDRYGRMATALFSESKVPREELPALRERNREALADFAALRGKTAKELLSPYVTDPELVAMITILTGFFGLGYDEIDALTFVMGDLSYRLPGEGAYYPKGGSGHMSKVVADLFLERGGTLLLGHRVTELTFSDGRADGIVARKASGRERTARARCVIANSDVTALVTELSPPGTFPDEYVQEIRDRVPCTSAVILYAGLDLDLHQLGIHDYEIHGSWGQESTTSLINEISRTGDYSLLPTGNVTAYSNVDPSCCPAGKSVISTICFAEPAVFEAALEPDGKRGERYKALKRRITAQLLEKMGRTLGVPDLERHVEVAELATPLTLMHYTLHRNGSFVGWRNTPDQGAFNAVSQQSPVENLLLCGHWVFPAGGVSPVISGGNHAAEMADRFLKNSR